MKYLKLIIVLSLLCFALVSCSEKNNFTEDTVASTSAETEEVVERSPLSTIRIDTETGRDVVSKEEYILTDFTLTNPNGKELHETEVKIRGRGNQSWKVPKKSYRLKFSEKISPLADDDYASKNWVLIASHSDKSFLRNHTAFAIGTALDGIEWSPRSELVEVYLNGEYRGIYVLTEQVQVSEGRVDITEGEDELMGALIELDGYAEGALYRDYFPIGKRKYTIKTDLTSATQGKELADHITQVYNTVRNGSYEEISQCIDLDSAVDMYLLCEYMVNCDAGFSSFFMYTKEASGMIFFGPPWDFDLSSGNTISAIDPTGLYLGKIYEEEVTASIHNVWFSSLIRYDWFKEMVVERWNEVKYTIASTVENCCTYAYDNMTTLEKNFEVWDVLHKSINQEPEAVLALNSCKENVDYMKDWLDTRWKWLDVYYNSNAFIMK